MPVAVVWYDWFGFEGMCFLSRVLRARSLIPLSLQLCPSPRPSRVTGPRRRRGGADKNAPPHACSRIPPLPVRPGPCVPVSGPSLSRLRHCHLYLGLAYPPPDRMPGHDPPLSDPSAVEG